jgi:predicted dinucleotide-binding enzyme
VKAFNQLPAGTLAAQVSAGQGKRVVFISSNSSEANSQITRFADRLGLSAVELGRIDEGGRLIEAPNALGPPVVSSEKTTLSGGAGLAGDAPGADGQNRGC